MPGTALAGPTGGLLLWLLYGLIGSLRVLRLPGGSAMTFHLPFVGAAMILGGPTAGAWVGFLATLERRELETQPWYGILANHSILVIGAVAGGLTTKLVGMAVGPDAGGAGLLASAVAGALVLTAVTTAIGAVTVLLREDLSVRALADILLGQFGRITAIECALVVVLALAYLQLGWWAPLLVAGFVLLVWDNDPLPPLDIVTGLPTRRAFDRALDAGVGRLRRGITPGATLMGIDLDGFSTINNTYGHAVGDEVLAEVGRRLKAMGRRLDDVAGRLGGDEFALWLPGLLDVSVALRRADELVAEIRKPIATSAGTVTVGASVGFVVVQAWGGMPSAEHAPGPRGRGDVPSEAFGRRRAHVRRRPGFAGRGIVALGMPGGSPPDERLAVLADERPARREAVRIERRDVDRGRGAVQDQLGHPEPDRRRRLEPRPAVAAVEVEAVRAGPAEHRSLVRGQAVLPGVRGPERRVNEARHPLDQALCARCRGRPGSR